MRAPLHDRVGRRIVAETRGNPLAILEVPRALTSEEITSGFVLPAGHALAGELEAGFRGRLLPLPAATKLLLLVAAAEPFADPIPIARAAVDLGIGAGQADVAASAVRTLAESTRTAGSDWALGVEARSRALAGDGADADAELHRREAVEQPRTHPHAS